MISETQKRTLLAFVCLLPNTNCMSTSTGREMHSYKGTHAGTSSPMSGCERNSEQTAEWAAAITTTFEICNYSNASQKQGGEMWEGPVTQADPTGKSNVEKGPTRLLKYHRKHVQNEQKNTRLHWPERSWRVFVSPSVLRLHT